MIEKIAFKIIHWIGSVSSLITHTLFFIIGFALYFSNLFDKNTVLLIITLIVSLEAIYLSIFIQMSVNSQSKKLQDVAQDLEEIQENVEDIQEDVEDIQEDVEGIQKDVEEIQEDVEEIQEDVEEINEEEDEEDEDEDEDIQMIKDTMNKLMAEVLELKKHYKKTNK